MIIDSPTSPFANVLRSGPFRVVYADPPWPTGKRASAGGWQRNLAPQYRTMRAKEILALPVRELRHPDGTLLVMWSTWMHLSLAMKALDAWGFTYCAGMPWIKTTKSGDPIYGLGIWFRGCSELVLVARAGQFPNPRPARKGLIQTAREAHSKKPAELRTWIERHFAGPRIELFAREEYDGWVSWGDEIQKSMNAAGDNQCSTS